MDLQEIPTLFNAIIDEVGKVMVGQAELVEGIVVALLSEGSVLLEGSPGLGKTLIVNALSQVISCDFKRVQFTPDLMPSDLTGHNVFDVNEGEFHFNAGPVFTNLLLADEINRSPPKTQSALLEVMQERQVTVDGKCYRLKRPYLVIGTQNPLEHEGTYPLPEAQVDRFLFKLIIDYPTPEEECAILQHFVEGRDTRELASFDLQPVLRAEDIPGVQEAIRGVIVEARIVDYIARIVDQTRHWHSIQIGASPRASINLLTSGRTIAACEGRDFVTPDDIKGLAPWVLRHRLRLRPEAELEGVATDAVIQELLEAVEAPRS